MREDIADDKLFDAVHGSSIFDARTRPPMLCLLRHYTTGGEATVNDRRLDNGAALMYIADHVDRAPLPLTTSPARRIRVLRDRAEAADYED